ncbi:MAG: exonuclease SbcCD subunit D [Chloroflexota bacterium]
MPIRVLHFADAHIDMANYGRHDPVTGLPQRVVDFLNALDQIVDAAIEEKVDLVLFAGDAYKDRNPQPTFQREWGKRMMRLSEAGIPTLLLIGNHDIAPAENRAHTLQEFKTLGVPHMHVADDGLQVWGPEELGIPVQIISLPWVMRSKFMARNEVSGLTAAEIFTLIENRVESAIEDVIEQTDPDLPLIFTAHASVSGAKFGSERQVMLGQELTLSRKIVSNPHFDYVALGHIHKHQSLNDHPPVVYAGSIERIDFGEAREKKGYVLAEVEHGAASWRFVPLQTRPFLDLRVEVRDASRFMESVFNQLPAPEKVKDAICRITLIYPQDLDPLLDEEAIREQLKDAFELRIVRQRLLSKRSRLGDTVAVESLSPYELLDLYWQTKEMPVDERDELITLAREVLSPEFSGSDPATAADNQVDEA